MTEQDSFAGHWALDPGRIQRLWRRDRAGARSKGVNILACISTDIHPPSAERVVSEIEGIGVRAVFFNINAASATKRAEVLDAIQARLGEDAQNRSVKVLFHSLAFGTLRAFVPKDPSEAITQAQMDMTLDVMAHSLVYWTQDLLYRGLMGPGSRIFAMTSSGSHRILPNYGAVSAAKASLESHIRQLAVEGPKRHNGQLDPSGHHRHEGAAGDPGAEKLVTEANARNPMGRGRPGPRTSPRLYPRCACRRPIGLPATCSARTAAKTIWGASRSREG